MKILRSWLKEYVDTDRSDQELDDLLTFSGTLVEQVTGGIDPKVIVAKILEINPHPNADRLRLVKVTDGENEIAVVCGAPNIEVGQIVPLAKVGATLGSMKIKEAEIRLEKSYGMLCSQKELGLGDDHEGIYILDDTYKIGDSLNQYIKPDSVFELEITPNRGDCLSHLGVAREVAALTNQKIKFHPQEFESLAKDPGKLKIEIQDPDSCFKYCGAAIKGVKIAPSPNWLKNKLLALGHNPINNVVDITNFIMEDMGQPLHAFDKNKVTGDTIIIRSAIDGEKITTIDEIERSLDKEMLVIADSRGPIALAGVMGGTNSAIDNDTTDIILESAVFERKSVRRTAKVLNLTTDASYRFERGIDAEITKIAMLKAAKMICEIAGGEVEETIVDTAREENNDWIKVEHEKINKLLGTEIENNKVDEYLSVLGFEIKDEMCLPPTWRHDVSIWQDLAEEVSRLFGFANIPMVQMEKAQAPKSSDFYFKECVKDILVAEGFTEVFTYPFLSDADINSIGLSPDALVEVANPVQSENKYMRSSLVPGLMRAIAKNPTFDPILIFEFGNVFTSDTELVNFSVASSGRGAKDIIENCVKTLSENNRLNVGEFEIKEYSRDDLQKYKIKKANVYVFEINSRVIIEAMRERGNTTDFKTNDKPTTYREISKFPPVNRDLAFIVDTNISLDQLEDEIYQISKNVVLVEPFDEFTDDRFGENKKSVALHVWLQDLDKTLSDSEAEKEISKIIITFTQKFEAKLRD